MKLKSIMHTGNSSSCDVHGSTNAASTGMHKSGDLDECINQSDLVDKSHFSTIVNLINDVVIVLDEQGTIQFINKAASKLFGYTEQVARGQSFPFLTQHSNDKIFENYLLHYLNDDKKHHLHQPFELWVESKDCQRFALSLEITNMQFEGKKSFICIMHDTTKYKQAQDINRQLEIEVRQAQKMETLGQLTSGIVHDFNNILASMLGYTDLALVSLGKMTDRKIKSYLSEVVQSGERAHDLVEQMLNFSRGGNSKPQLISLDALAAESLSMLRPTLASGMDIRLVADEGLPQVLLEPIQFHQLIMNLCINARDAMQAEGCVDIQIHHIGNCDLTCSSCKQSMQGQYVKVSIADSGTGIAPEALEHMFEPFYTTKEIGRGTGLGLATVQRIMHNYQGHIVVHSVLGQGTVFELYFPVPS